MTISQKFNTVDTVKAQIKAAIENKGVTITSSDTFATYPSKISAIPDASEYIGYLDDIEGALDDLGVTVPASYADLDDTITNSYTDIYTELQSISGGTVPTSTINITENGTYNVADYASANVNVSGGSGVGITREVDANGGYGFPASNFTFSLPSNATDLKANALYFAFYVCTSLVSVDLSSLIKVSSNNALAYAFNTCTNLTNVDLRNLTTLSGHNIMYCTFYHCSALTSVDLSSLAKISGSDAMYGAFQYCPSLTSLSFPALTSTFNIPESGTTYTNQFNYMLNGVTGCTVHFPSNLQSVIGSWSDVTAGFGGTNTTVLFDLPATT